MRWPSYLQLHVDDIEIIAFELAADTRHHLLIFASLGLRAGEVEQQEQEKFLQQERATRPSGPCLAGYDQYTT